MVTRPVVSADDVRAAHRRNERSVPIPSGAIVTPLAREEAAKWGIELTEPAEPRPGKPRGEASAGHWAAACPASPTCDPHDVQRIVDRVRERVPRADPASIREIARRVLEEENR